MLQTERKRERSKELRDCDWQDDGTRGQNGRAVIKRRRFKKVQLLRASPIEQAIENM